MDAIAPADCCRNRDCLYASYRGHVHRSNRVYLDPDTAPAIRLGRHPVPDERARDGEPDGDHAGGAGRA